MTRQILLQVVSAPRSALNAFLSYFFAMTNITSASMKQGQPQIGNNWTGRRKKEKTSGRTSTSCQSYPSVTSQTSSSIEIPVHCLTSASASPRRRTRRNAEFTEATNKFSQHKKRFDRSWKHEFNSAGGISEFRMKFCGGQLACMCLAALAYHRGKTALEWFSGHLPNKFGLLDGDLLPKIIDLLGEIDGGSSVGSESDRKPPAVRRSSVGSQNRKPPASRRAGGNGKTTATYSQEWRRQWSLW